MSNVLKNIKKTKALHLGIVIGRFLLKLPNNYYLLRPHKSDKTFLLHRTNLYLDKDFGEKAIKANGDRDMYIREAGFHDGYIECLKDLGIKLTSQKGK